MLDRFSAQPAEVVWYYRSLVEAFEAHGLEGDARALLDELGLVVDDLA